MSKSQRRRHYKETLDSLRKLERRERTMTAGRMIAGRCNSCGAKIAAPVHLTPNEMLNADFDMRCGCGYTNSFNLRENKADRWANNLEEVFNLPEPSRRSQGLPGA